MQTGANFVLENCLKPAIGNRKSKIAFTLVELLVVITIIVILLVLLAPAMDRAIYQADLLACATNLNYAFADGSVDRLERVKTNKVVGEEDERVVRVPILNNAQSAATWYQQVPRP